MNQNPISALVGQQLPAFIRDDYPKFITFMEKYYEWMELEGNAVYESQQFKNAQDLDLAPDYYIDLIKKEFLPFFPEVTTMDSRKFLKLVNQFYSSKGTPDSVKFLFRALYNENIEITFPKDDVLKVSDGKWVLPLALRIDTQDPNILNIENCLITGQTSKATALVESITQSIDRQLGIRYIEAYVSNVDRLFSTGETITATYNDGFNDITVTGKIIGALSEIKINPSYRGLYYNGYNSLYTGYPGDPVTIIGGLNANSNNHIGAVAYVGTTTTGAITDITVQNGGFGFRDPVLYANSSIIDFKGGFDTSLRVAEASAVISLLDYGTYRSMNVSNTMIDYVISKTLDNIGSTGNAVTSTILSMSGYETINVYPISFVTVTGSGGGYTGRPDVDVYSYYNTDSSDILVSSSVNLSKGSSVINDSTQNLMTTFQVGDKIRLFVQNQYEEVKNVIDVTTNSVTVDVPFLNDISGVSVYKMIRSEMRQLGTLGRIEIDKPGSGYAVGEYLVFTGGDGYGANAKISSVYANNGIKAVEFNETTSYVVGGEGYRATNLPSITVATAGGIGASLRVSEISGDGENLLLGNTKIGAISSLRIISYGYDYVSTPTVSLRNADIVVSNVTAGQIFISNSAIYQGTTNALTTWTAYVDSYSENTQLLRVFDYKGTFDPAKSITSDDGVVSANVVSIITYGDGRARANAKFENGLIRYPGLYLNSDGQLSSDKKIQDGTYYHNFSYVISTNKDYASFKSSLDNIVHPAGTVTFVNRLKDTQIDINNTLNDERIKQITLKDTFNIAYNANNIVSTNVSANLISLVSVGDIITVTGMVKLLSGNVNTTAGSNTVLGYGTNFLNELNDGDIVSLTTGNTETVVVTGNTSIVTQNTIGVTSNNTMINVVFDDTKTVTFVNANTILVDTLFTANAKYANVTLQKVS